MKINFKLFFALAILLSFTVGMAVPLGASQSSQDADNTPPWHRRIYGLFPTQLIHVRNRNYEKIEIHSKFPISVIDGECKAFYKRFISCDDLAEDVVVMDVRDEFSNSALQKNIVTVTFYAR